MAASATVSPSFTSTPPPPESQVIAVLATRAAKIPASGNGGFSLHIVRADNPSCAVTVPLFNRTLRHPARLYRHFGYSLDIAGSGQVQQAM
ncbi:hypothetical protein MY10362_007757, partial [Beauveria mimosiformis]